MITFPRLFKPGCVVTCANQQVNALGITPGAHDPRVVFRVRRTMTSTPDTAEVTIFGLAPERRTAMQALFGETGHAQLQIGSGYDGTIVPLFRGDVRKMHANERVGDDYVVRVWADDGGDALSEATIPPAVRSTAGFTVQNMIDLALLALNDQIARDAVKAGAEPIPIVAHPSVATAVASVSPAASAALYASVAVGKASQLLDEAARTLGCRWWIRDSQLFMAKRRVPIDGLAIALPRDHWLDEPVDDGSGIVKVVTFLDPNIVPGRQIALIGRAVPGASEVLRVEACDYAGDGESSAPWSVAIEARRFAL